MLPLYLFCHFLLPIFHKFHIVWSDMQPEWALNTTSSLSSWQYAFITLQFLPHFLELLGTFHLVKISLIFGSAVNGTRFVGSSHWKIPGKSGKSENKVGPFFRLEFPNGMSCSIHVSRSLYQFQVHGRAPRHVPGFTTKWNKFFANRKFHFCYHRNFRVFFVNGKRPLFRPVEKFPWQLKRNVGELFYSSLNKRIKKACLFSRCWHDI